MVSPVRTPSGGVQSSSGFRHAVVARPGPAKQVDTDGKSPATADAAMPSPDTVRALFAYYRSIGAIPSDALSATAREDDVMPPTLGSPARPAVPEDAVAPSGPGKPSPADCASGALDSAYGPAAAGTDPTASGSTSLYVPRSDQDPKFLYLAWDAPFKLPQASRFYGEVLKAVDMFPTSIGTGETS